MKRFFVSLAIVLATSSALAQSTDEGRSHFQRGVQLYKENDFRAALIEFERAYQAAPNYKVLYNLGQTSLELQDYAAALRSFRKYLDEGAKDVPKDRRSQVEGEIRKLEGRVARVTVKSNIEGADVMVDDVVVGKTPLASPVLVSAGRRKISVSKAGSGQQSRTVDVAGGDDQNVERYLDIFCTGMKNKWDLVYADLLAGPGRCIDQDSRQESDGSPLLAVRRDEFQRLFLNDQNQDAASALTSRTTDQPPGRVRVEALDCNTAVDPARAFLFPQGGADATLGLAVIDPTAFQFSYDALTRLTSGVKLDLIIIFMSDFIRRFIGTPEFEVTMDRFYGTTAWRRLLDSKKSGEAITYRKLLDLYEEQLKLLGYLHPDDMQRMTTLRGKTIYHVVFASRHPRGAEFFQKISKMRYSGQIRLPI